MSGVLSNIARKSLKENVRKNLRTEEEKKFYTEERADG